MVRRQRKIYSSYSGEKSSKYVSDKGDALVTSSLLKMSVNAMSK